MFIPYQVDVPTDRWPICNYLIVIAAIVVFISQCLDPYVTQTYILEGWTTKGLFGHMWLHGGILHLVGNMIFLFVFGNAVCSKTGNIIYPVFYVILGLAAACTHVILDGDKALGASGAINGIVGLYLVLYPLNEVSCALVWFPYIRTFSVSGFWLILLWCGFDIWGIITGGEGVAYFVHLGGFVAGFTLAITLLKINVVKMDETEKSLLQIWQEKSGKSTPNEPQKYGDTKSPVYAPLTDNGNVITHTEPQTNNGSKDKYIDGDRDRHKADDNSWVHIPIPEQTNHSAPTSPKAKIRGQFIYFKCDCGKSIKVPIHNAGKTGRCPGCHKSVQIPKITDPK